MIEYGPDMIYACYYRKSTRSWVWVAGMPEDEEPGGGFVFNHFPSKKGAEEWLEGSAELGESNV